MTDRSSNNSDNTTKSVSYDDDEGSMGDDEFFINDNELPIMDSSKRSDTVLHTTIDEDKEYDENQQEQQQQQQQQQKIKMKRIGNTSASSLPHSLGSFHDEDDNLGYSSSDDDDDDSLYDRSNNNNNMQQESSTNVAGAAIIMDDTSYTSSSNNSRKVGFRNLSQAIKDEKQQHNNPNNSVRRHLISMGSSGKKLNTGIENSNNNNNNNNNNSNNNTPSIISNTGSFIGNNNNNNNTTTSNKKQQRVKEALLKQGHNIDALSTRSGLSSVGSSNRKIMSTNNNMSRRTLGNNNETTGVVRSEGSVDSEQYNYNDYTNNYNNNQSNTSVDDNTFIRKTWKKSLLGSKLQDRKRTKNNINDNNNRNNNNKNNNKNSLSSASSNNNGNNTTTSPLIQQVLSSNSSNNTNNLVTAASLVSTTINRRRYREGDYVLVRNKQSKWANLVNRYGFPIGEGVTIEERMGPYEYVLATVKQIHYEEAHPYYTVTRIDTGGDQRADADFMEPLRTQRGEQAAFKAATGSFSNMQRGNNPFHNNNNNNYIDSVLIANQQSSKQIKNIPNKISIVIQTACYYTLLPFLWLLDCIHFISSTCFIPMYCSFIKFIKRQSKAFLYGNDPYVCRIRLTIINFVVLCSTWFLFADQLRLAFCPPSADYALAIVNFTVWIVLVLELLFQVYIRPDGYNELIVSEKAFAPTTVRYINAFHLFIESVTLGIFFPEFGCIFMDGISCSDRLPFSLHNALLMSVIGPTRRHLFYSYAFLALTRLRIFALIRHWRNMWISNTFINMKWNTKRTGFVSHIVPSGHFRDRSSISDKRKKKFDTKEREQIRKDAVLTNASNIGTALMSHNSYRAFVIVLVVVGIFPIAFSLSSTMKNEVAKQMTLQLQATNLVATDTSNETCSYLFDSVASWLVGVSTREYLDEPMPYLLTLDLQPYRCDFDGSNLTNIIMCDILQEVQNSPIPICEEWSEYARLGLSTEELASLSGIRSGSILEYDEADMGILKIQDIFGSNFPLGILEGTEFSVSARFDESVSIRTAAISSLLLQMCLLGAVLGGLSILRRDAEVLVLGPLRRMLRIVARYARNPLAQPKIKKRKSLSRGRFSTNTTSSDNSRSSSDEDSTDEEDMEERALGSFETEQLITAVTKITSLLRKCWGVAGADIISTNLASREGALAEVFNPTVPGKSVYALFAFAAIGGFDDVVRNLGGDIMPLINDVAAVLHGEVFRWGFGESGQCNKNLGGAFLMVFRIGLVKEVIEKLEQATDVVFSTSSGKSSQVSSAAKRRMHHRHGSSMRSSNDSMSTLNSSSDRNPSSRSAGSHLRRKARRSTTTEAMSLSLQSLPGISTFTDRAVIGMLKSFAGIHRDREILKWNDDLRLGFGVGAFKISMIFGMDAGWAVEGAVGSEYKIDATYLSPHVNMASRMTSACKQYDVSIMLSQSVQELMSDVGQSKLRHLDTVTVKGSSVKQKIYTYDARSRGVDFFLHCRSEEQADFEADRYSPNIWINDPDLIAMRQHVTEDFLNVFKEGHKAYLSGDWKSAIEKLERANHIMFQTAVDEGYLEDELAAVNLLPGADVRGAGEELKREYGDGPSIYLLSFMKSQGGVAPKNWDGWHPLTRK